MIIRPRSSIQTCTTQCVYRFVSPTALYHTIFPFDQQHHLLSAMFAIPSTPTHNRGSTWSRYITPDLTPSFPTSSSFVERTLSTQSLNHQPFSSPSPTSSRSLALASPVQTPFDHPFVQRQSTPAILEDDFHLNPMHATYPNTPSPQPFGVIGGLYVSEPASMLQ